MPRSHRKAGSPPKKINEKKQSARSNHSDSASKPPSVEGSASSTSTEDSHSDDTQTISRSNNNEGYVVRGEYAFCLDSLSESDRHSADPHPTTSLPLWAHRYGIEPVQSSRFDNAGDDDGNEVTHPRSRNQLSAKGNLPDRNTGRETVPRKRVFAINYEENVFQEPSAYSQPQLDAQQGRAWVYTGEEAVPREPEALAAAGYQQSVDEFKDASTYDLPQKDAQILSCGCVAVEHLPTTRSDYQMGTWASSTHNAEVPLSERLEKSKWQSQCLSRL